MEMRHFRISFTECWSEDRMERVNRICKHPLWGESLGEIQKMESDRIFCRHDIIHFMDVARIAYIENLEKGLGISKDWIYAAALLHDIGRHMQYSKGIPHDIASVQLAEEILEDCGFKEDEKEEIKKAIGSHRAEETASADNLAGILYRADKQSRNCLFCSACSECNWSEEKKNLILSI